MNDPILVEAFKDLRAKNSKYSIEVIRKDEEIRVLNELLLEMSRLVADSVGMIKRIGYDEKVLCPTLLEILNNPKIKKILGTE